MIHISAPTDDIGIAVLAETARATATQHGGGCLLYTSPSPRD